MKTKLFTIFSALILMASCGEGYNPPSNTNNDVVNIPKPKASFSYKTKHPHYVYFTNTSSEATYYNWDFGDGKTSKEESPVHQYKSKGVYKVTLKASRGLTNNGYLHTDTYTQNITVTDPTKCYVTGVKFEKIPKNNEYYNIRFTDDYMMFETLYWHTSWVLLSSANIPFTYNFTKSEQINFDYSKYVMRLYTNSGTTGKGTQVKAWTINTADLKAKFAEVSTGTADNASVSIFYEWKD